MSFSGKVAAITGAGSGIGQALACRLASEGCSVSICDVNEEGLKETAERIAKHNVGCLVSTVDVTDRQAVESWAEKTIQELGGADYVFNNAGVALIDRVETIKYDDFNWLMNINFWGMVYGSKAFLDHFKEKDSGHIINVSSLFGLIAVPGQAAYNASKYAIRGFTEALAQELKGSGVAAHSVHPGGIRTNIAKNARFVNSGPGGGDHQDMQKNFEKIAKTTPDQAADVILKGVEAGKMRILIGGDARLLDRIQRFMPEKYPSFLSLLFKK